MEHDVLIIIQARYNSKRLPGKVLLPLSKKPVLSHVFDRAKLINSNHPILCAIGKDKGFIKIKELCENNSIKFYIGPTKNVLKRFYDAYKSLNKNIKYIMRITGDCPLIDPDVCNELISLTLKNNFDYSCNVSNPLFPHGLDCEIFKFSKLKEAFENASYDFEKEHVTQFIRNNKNNLCGEIQCPHKGLENFRWTLDNHKDYLVLKKIFSDFQHIIEEKKYLPLARAILKTKNNFFFSNQYPRYKGLMDSVQKEHEINKIKIDGRIKHQI